MKVDELNQGDLQNTRDFFRCPTLIMFSCWIFDTTFFPSLLHVKHALK